MINIESVKDQRYHEAAARIMSQDGYVMDFMINDECSFAEYRVAGPELRISGGHKGHRRIKIEIGPGDNEPQFIGLDFVLRYTAESETRVIAAMERVAEALGYKCHCDPEDARFSKANVLLGDEGNSHSHALKENWFFFIPKDVE